MSGNSIQKLPNLNYLEVANNSMDVSELFRMTNNTRHLDHLWHLGVSFQMEQFLGWKKFEILSITKLDVTLYDGDQRMPSVS